MFWCSQDVSLTDHRQYKRRGSARKVQTYLNDPQAYQKVGAEQRELDEFRYFKERESKWASKKQAAENRKKNDESKPSN